MQGSTARDLNGEFVTSVVVLIHDCVFDICQ
jgi:hypothetical protein